MPHSAITTFIQKHFRHFNARVLREAADGYKQHLEAKGKMFVALGGAMSTAEIGVSMAEMIREGKIHAVSCTGANLEEDIFNLVAHDEYRRVPDYRSFGPSDDAALFRDQLNRVTDTCIPDAVIWQRLEAPFMEVWKHADRHGERLLPYECVFKALSNDSLTKYFAIDTRDSWVCAALEKNVPIFVPGWEDSSLGNMYAAACMRGDIVNVGTIKSGTETMVALADWYSHTAKHDAVGFFQVGGGVAGDFAICVVPMLHTDLLRTDLPRWRYFCQIGDSVTSYGSYSGATPSEKVSWGKLDPDTPNFMIESDATIVVPLIFAYVLGW
jgi:deoxyhypusine synthase